MKVGVGMLFAHGGGRQLDLQIDAKLSIPEELRGSFTPTSNFSGEITLVRSELDILALLKDAKIEGKVHCVKCLQEAEIEINIPNAEQIFYAKTSAELGEEQFAIEADGMRIDLDPFLIQELSVHIPLYFQHRAGECDPESLKRLKTLSQSKIDLPLASLRALLPFDKSERS